jgi:8-oxo-dGTP diphosphatase
MQESLTCPACGATVSKYRNPFVTVDVIIHDGNQVILIERRNPPSGWALPGGFVDYGESLETAVTREAREETGLALIGLKQFRAYSEPTRDPRQHNIAVVFTARGAGTLHAGDDAKAARWFSLDALPTPLCFDHGKILADFQADRANYDAPG